MMSRMKKVIFSLTLLLIFAISVAAGCVDMPERKPRERIELVIAVDASTAVDRRCAEVVERVRRVLARPDARRLELAVLSTGDHSTGFEPVTLVPWKLWAPKPGLYEAQERLSAEREGWITEVGSACGSAIRPRDVSAIHAAAQRAVEAARSRCAEAEANGERCREETVALHSDLRENIEVHIRSALLDLSKLDDKRDDAKLEHLALPRIDTSGISFAVCGVADTTLAERERMIQPRVLVEVWAQVLGIGPEHFDPVCATGEALGGKS